MSYRTRLTALVAAFLLLTVVGVSVSIAWGARRAMLAEAELDGQLVAKVLARSAALARQIPREVEKVVGDMMAAQGTIAARMVAEAERAGRSADEINAILIDIVARSMISEFWITDENGHAYLRSVPEADFTFDPDPARQPQAHVFWPLLSGGIAKVDQEARKREIDDRAFKYVGVPGVDRSRIVQVGIEAEFLEALADRIGLHRMVEGLLAEGDVNAIWVIGTDLHTLARASVYGSDVNSEPDSLEQDLLRRVLGKGTAASAIDVSHLAVVSPIVDEGRMIGAAVVRLPLDKVQGMLHGQAVITTGIALVTMLVGALAAVWASRRVTVPVMRLTEAALAIEERSFKPGGLAEVARRADEFGHLGKVFERMAEDVLTREEQLDALVRERTRELEAKTGQLVAAHQRIDDELRVAQTLQIAMLPTEFPSHPQYQMFGIMSPAREVGGDFFDYLVLDARRLLVAIGDVSGKGVPAAFFMVLARALLQNAAAAGQPPAAILSHVNDHLGRNNPMSLFVTVFCGILDTGTGEFCYSNGGHNPPLRLTADGDVETLRPTGDMALGILEGETYNEASLVLGPGDSLLLYTDGLTEVFSPAGDLFGEARLIQALRRTRGLSMQALVVDILQSMETFAAGLEPPDDTTCLALCYRGPGKPESGCEVRMGSS